MDNSSLRALQSQGQHAVDGLNLLLPPFQAKAEDLLIGMRSEGRILLGVYLAVVFYTPFKPLTTLSGPRRAE